MTETSPKMEMEEEVSRSPWVRKRLISVAFLVLSSVVLLGIWVLFTSVLHVSIYSIPKPLGVYEKLRDGFFKSGGVTNYGSIGSSSYIAPTIDTIKTTAIGFFYGGVLGLILGGLLAEWRLLQTIFMPYMAGFQSIPKVALAPLFIIWFGFGDFSQEMLATSLVFFPVAVNTLNGLRGVSPSRLEMARSYGNHRLRSFLYVRVPAAAPSIFTGLELGVVYSLLGVIASELIAGNLGIGALLTAQEGSNDLSGMFAMLIVSGVVGGAYFGVLRLIRRRVLFWEGHAV